MAGVQTTLSLQDRLSGPLVNMMRAMDSTIRVMEQMDSAATSIDVRGLENARRAIDNASADMARLNSATGSAGDSAGHAAQQQSELNESISSGIPSIAKFTSGLLAAVGAYKLFGAAKNVLRDMFSKGIDFIAFKEASQVAFTTFLGDAEKATQYMDDMYAFALTTPFAYPDLLESSRNLIAFGVEAKNTFPIMQAIGDAVAGIGGGNAEMQSISDIFGMIQVQGKITMMEVNRLGKHGVNAIDMLATQAGVSGEAIKKQITDGAVDAGTAITGLVTGMDKQFGGLMAGVKGTWAGTIDSMKSSIRNAGTKMMEGFIEPFKRSIGNLTALIKRIPEYIGPALAAFLPAINMLNDAFEAGRFDVFFATMSASLTVIAYLFSAVAEGAIFVAQAIDTFWPTIVTALVLTAATYIPMVITGLWGMITTLYTVGRAWLVAMGPVGWVILAITVVIGIVQLFGVTSQQILGFVGALFFALGAGIWNVIATLWNYFAMFAEFLINLFIDPTYAMKKLIYDMVMMGIESMTALAGSFDSAANVLGDVFVAGANIAIGAINGLIKAINMIPGVDIGEVGKLSVTGANVSGALKNMANNLKAPTSSKAVVSIPRLSLKSMPGAIKSGMEAGSNFKMPGFGGAGGLDMPKLDMPTLDMPGMGSEGLGKKPKTPKSAKGKNPTGGKLDSVGKIEDDISIADEDLKMLKELADIRSIQNFQTLQPSFTFGDMTIREDADIKKIISGIETYMRKEMDRSSEGVYA